MRKTITLDMKLETTYKALEILAKKYNVETNEMALICIVDYWMRQVEENPALKAKLLRSQKRSEKIKKNLKND